MRRYTITVNDKTKVIDVEATGMNTFRVQVDGRWVEVTLQDHRDLAHPAPITPFIQTKGVPGAVPDIGVPQQPPAGEPTGGSASGRVASAPSPMAPGGPRPGPVPDGGGRSTLTAPMPGVILSVNTSVGAQVKRGEALLVLEAMKMKNELHATRDGKVVEIGVVPGQQVRYGETLIRFEEN